MRTGYLENIFLGEGGGSEAESLQGRDIARQAGEPSQPVAEWNGQERKSGLLRIKQSHHNLARLIALGQADNIELSAATGYAPGTISSLRRDPAFAELVSTYQAKRDIAFGDTADRLKILSLNAMSELQRRLDEDPEAWSRRELMELAELGAVKAPNAAAAGAVSAGGISLSVSFVRPDHPETLPSITIDGDILPQ